MLHPVLCGLAAALVMGAPVAAQTFANPATPGVTPSPAPATPPNLAPAVIPALSGLPAANPLTQPTPAVPVEMKKGQLYLSALLAPHDAQPIGKGPLIWRVFEEKAGADGRHKLVLESKEAAPALALPEGTYIVHASLDLASAVRRVTVSDQASSERVVLNAGALRIVGMLGDQPINPTKLQISIFIPEAGNSEAKLVVARAKAGDLIGLPEGNYHVVSTLLDTAGYSGTQQAGVGNKTNSVVSADLKVQSGKLTDATLRHRSAVMTLKLVSTPGGEALANTSFTILTPGGDVIREMIGAFPSLVLAEGEYVAIARHDAKTYQTTFKVDSTLDRDVEVVAK
ncbi:hypothetical protein [Beijerinckia sp. L45]|uniref:hypothetical protein n=1 Tax=Beijerinckia sp. L45 TaxID=1641855 RepID=UPI001AED7534|nr:hypothetical protein [Beijerinckia sp. L45]